MPAGDSMPDTYIAIMLQSLKKKEQVLDERYPDGSGMSV